MPKLLVEKGNNRNTVIDITQSKPVTVGRDPNNDFQLHDIMSSRKHFKIFHNNATYIIEDLNSSNGTFVNGSKIRTQTLNIGDKIQVGDTIMSILEDKETKNSGGLVGKELGGYRIIERLGRGAMGTVFKAVQKSLDRIVALKILAPELLKNKDFIDMFVKEARASGQLNHPNIIQVYDVGDFKGVWYFSMEYAEFGSVADRIENNQKIPVIEAIPMIIQACKGLEYAERKQIVHRDIKPDNLFIGAEHDVKLGDLGLAQKSGEREEDQGVFGTPHYIAPEQAMGENVDQRADIYSLGATFYRMIIGETPFQGANVKEVLRKQVKEEPPEAMLVNPTVPKSINDIIKKMMAKDPAKRYQSATDLIKTLEKAQKILTKPAVRKSVPATANNMQLSASKYVGTSKKSSNAPLIIGILVVAAVILIGAIAFVMNNKGKDDNPNRTVYTPGGNVGNIGTNIDNGTDEPASIDDDDDPVENDDDDDVEPVENDDDDDDTTDNNKTVNNNNDDNNKTPPGDPSIREKMFKRNQLFGTIRVKIREVCQEKKLGQISADDYASIEGVVTAIEALASEYKDNELLKNFDNPAETAASELKAIITELKKQAVVVESEFVEISKTANELIKAEEYGAAYKKLKDFQTDINSGAFNKYTEFMNSWVEGDTNIDFSKVKQSKEMMNKLVTDLAPKYTEIESTYTKGYAEIKGEKNIGVIIDKLEELLKPYEKVIDKWAGIEEYTKKADEKIKEIKIELEKNKALLKQKASKAAQEFAAKLAPVIREVIDYSKFYKFEEAEKAITELEKLQEYKFCLEQSGKDEFAKRIINVYQGTVEQIKYAKHFMNSFERDLKRSNTLRISKPLCIQDYDVMGDTITIKGYKDGKLEVKRTTNTSKGNLIVNLYELTGKCVFELIDEAMSLSKEKDPKILIGAAYVLLVRNLPEYAIKVLEKADELSEKKDEKETIREFMTYAMYDEINHLNSIGLGIQARKLLEKFNKEYSDTQAYKNIFDPPIEIPASKADPTKKNNNGKGF